MPPAEQTDTAWARAPRAVSRSRRVVIPPLPAAIRTSPLMASGGFALIDLFSATDHARLLLEARRLQPRARTVNVQASDDEEVRGGDPARRFSLCAGGSVQGRLYRSSRVLRALEAVARVPLDRPGTRGGFGFYTRRGDHLAIHRDFEHCDLTVITCLVDGPRPRGRAGMLSLYPDRLLEPLSSIRATPDRGAVRLRLAPGETLVLFGGIVPHGLLPVGAHHTRIISTLCYEVRLHPDS